LGYTNFQRQLGTWCAGEMCDWSLDYPYRALFWNRSLPLLTQPKALHAASFGGQYSALLR